MESLLYWIGMAAVAVSALTGVLDAGRQKMDLVGVVMVGCATALGAVMLVPALNERFTRLMTPLASGADGLSGRIDAGSLWGALLLGGLLGLVWSPCSGPLLISALTLVASEGGALRGTLILGTFGFGAAIPLVAAAYASRVGFAQARGWVLAHAKAMKNGFGVLLVFLGGAILLGWDKRLEALVIPLLPDWWVNLTVAI